MNITLTMKDFHYQCPFLGSRNSCGALNEGINVCPVINDDTDEIEAPKNCPLLTGYVTVSLEN